MIKNSQLKPFVDGCYLEISNGTLLISNLETTIANSIPIDDETIDVKVSLSKEAVKQLKALTKQTKTGAYVRSVDDETITFSSRGIDLAVPKETTETTEIREVLRNFWTTKPKEAIALSSNFLTRLKQVLPFICKDEYRLYSCLIGGSLVATNGHALIAIENPIPEIECLIPRQEAEYLSTWKIGLFHETEDHWIFSNRQQSIVLRKDKALQFPPWENVIPKADSLTQVPLTKTIRKLIIDASTFPRDLGEPHFEMQASDGVITIESCLQTKRFKKSIEDFWVKFNASLIKSEAKSLMSFKKSGSTYVFSIPKGKVVLMGIAQ